MPLTRYQVRTYSREERHIQDRLRWDPSSTEPPLMQCGMRNPGARFLANELRTNRTITSLNLSFNYIGPTGAEALAEALKSNKTVTSLNLENNNIGDKGAKAIADLLAKNQTLKSINIGCNYNISITGVKYIANVLKTNQSLTTLDLNDIVGPNDAKELAQTLKINKSLTAIVLDCNTRDEVTMGQEGIEAISDALKNNNTLKSISLWGHDLSTRGIKIIAGVIKENRSLTSIDLGHNDVVGEGMKAIAEALETNKSLSSIKLDNFHDRRDAGVAVKNILFNTIMHKNTSLSEVVLEKPLPEVVSEKLKSNLPREQKMQCVLAAIIGNGTNEKAVIEENEKSEEPVAILTSFHKKRKLSHKPEESKEKEPHEEPTAILTSFHKKRKLSHKIGEPKEKAPEKEPRSQPPIKTAFGDNELCDFNVFHTVFRLL